MKEQDKQAEIDHSRGEFRQGSWDDSDSQRRSRTKQIELISLPAHRQVILDAGCGPGTYGMVLARQGNDVVGIDISPEAAGVVKSRAGIEKAGMVATVGDMEHLPFKEASFDVCFCGYALHHFPNISTVIGELTRVLKPEGTLVIAEPNRSNPIVRLNGMTKDLCRGWLTRSALDTPNETLHDIGTYTVALSRNGIVGVRIESCLSGGLPPLPTSSSGIDLWLRFIRLFVRLRRFALQVCFKLLPQPTNGQDVLIIGTKGVSAPTT